MRFTVTKFADIVMYEVLKQIDEKVDEKRNENQMCAFIREQVVHIHMLDKIENTKYKIW